MKVIVTIRHEGKPREAIPVRAIPWATDFHVSPILLAEDLSRSFRRISGHSGRTTRLPDSTAYVLIEDGKARAIRPKEWDAIVKTLHSIDEELKEEGLSCEQDRRQWERRATAALPAGAFLWLDEFDSAFRRGWEGWPHPMIEGEDGGYISVEREGDREYTCYPMIRQDLEKVILDGFAATRSSPEEPANQCAESDVRRNIEVWYPDFLRLVEFDGSSDQDDGCVDWVCDWRICPTGIFLAISPHGVYLSHKERAALPRHPTGDYSQPILAFPCTLANLLARLEEDGLSDCIDPATLDLWVSERITAPPRGLINPASGPDTGGMDKLLQADWRNNSALLKSEKQDRAVAASIEAKGWAALSVPDGEKSTLEALCKAEYPELFTAQTAFGETWKRGLRNKLWRMRSHASYAKRGRN